MWAQPMRPVRPFAGTQTHVDFTSDVMWDETGSFVQTGTHHWPHPPPPPPLPRNSSPHPSQEAPFYRREKKAPTQSKKKGKKNGKSPPASKLKSVLIRTSQRQQAKRQTAGKAAGTPKTSSGSAKKGVKTPVSKATKKTKKAPVKSAEEVAEETRISAMKNTAQKIKTLLQRQKCSAAAAPAADSAQVWPDAAEQQAAAGASGPRASRNLLGELEFSSTDWQAIGSGGLGASSAADGGAAADSEDDTVEIIEREPEEPEVISIAGEDDSDEEEEGEQGVAIVEVVADTRIDSDGPPEESVRAASPFGGASGTGQRSRAGRQEGAGLGESGGTLASLDIGPLPTPAVTGADAETAAAASAASDAPGTPAAAGPPPVTGRAELDEFDAADITVTGGGSRRVPSRGLRAGSVPSPAILLPLDGGDESDGSTASLGWPLHMPRLEESPTRTDADGTSSPGGLASTDRPSQSESALHRSSPRLCIRRARAIVAAVRQRQRGPLPVMPPGAEALTGADLQPVVRIKREPGLDDAIAEARGATALSLEDSGHLVCSPPAAASPTEPRAESPTVVGVLWGEQPASRPQTPPREPPSRPAPVRKPRKSRAKRATPPSSKLVAPPVTEPAVHLPPSRPPGLPSAPPVLSLVTPRRETVVPPAVCVPPSVDRSAPTVSPPADGRKRRVSDTQSPPGLRYWPPVPSKRVRSSSECSVLAEPPAPGPRPPPPGAADSLVRRLIRMGTLRTAVDDPSLLRSRHIMTELMRAYRGQQARRMELERFAAAGARGSPVRRDSDEPLPAEVLSDIRRILEKGRPLGISSPPPTGLLSAERLGVRRAASGETARGPTSAPAPTQTAPGLTVSSATGLSTTTTTTTSSGGGAGRGRVAQSVAAAFARRANLVQLEAAGSPRREDSAGSARLPVPAAPQPSGSGGAPDPEVVEVTAATGPATSGTGTSTTTAGESVGRRRQSAD